MSLQIFKKGGYFKVAAFFENTYLGARQFISIPDVSNLPHGRVRFHLWGVLPLLSSACQ